VAKALEVRDSWQRMKSNGEVLYVTESALFDVSVLTLNEPAVDLVELRLMEESRRLWITQSEIRFDQTRIVEKLTHYWSPSPTSSHSPWIRPTLAEIMALEVRSSREVDALNQKDRRRN
jgi:hypothetical protein